MSRINEATSLKSKIENHSHYGPCFNGDDYSIFKEKRDELNRIKGCYDSIIDYERYIIDQYYANRSKENELGNNRDSHRRELDYKRRQYSNEEELQRKNNENIINNSKKELENYKLQNECELKQIKEDISNLKKEIDELNKKNEVELELKKREKLSDLKNEYKIKLIKYKHMKELDKKRKEKNLLIKKKEFEAQKEIELNEMKNKAELVQKIISMCKNISLN